MKKLMSLILVLILCLSLCACGGSSKLTAADVEEALSECDGTLNLETSGDEVTGFTFTVEGVNADDLVDKKYSRDAINAILSGDTANTTYGQYKVCKGFLPLMSIEVLFGGNEKNFNSGAFIEKLLGIVCDGNSAQYDGWVVTAKVDQGSDSITISVNSQ